MVIPVCLWVHNVVVGEHQLSYHCEYVVGKELIEVTWVLHLVVADHNLSFFVTGNEVALLLVSEVTRC